MAFVVNLTFLVMAIIAFWVGKPMIGLFMGLMIINASINHLHTSLAKFAKAYVQFITKNRNHS
jgi:hypothetical protein